MVVCRAGWPGRRQRQCCWFEVVCCSPVSGTATQLSGACCLSAMPPACIISTSCSCRQPPPNLLRLPQVEALHTLMLHCMDDDSFVLATTVAAARLLAQVGLGVQCGVLGTCMWMGECGEASVKTCHSALAGCLSWHCSQCTHCLPLADTPAPDSFKRSPPRVPPCWHTLRLRLALQSCCSTR